ncbi:MAG: general stress protein [Bacillus sp. (in: firmicutes)]
MEKTVYGVYDDGASVMRAIEVLETKGYEEKNITIIADSKERLRPIAKSDHNHVKTIAEKDAKKSLADKLLNFFYDKSPDISEHLERQGLSKNEASAYMKDIHNGKILVLLDLKADKQPQKARLQESPSLQAMERYNTGLGMAEQPVIDPNADVAVDEDKPPMKER